MEPDYLSSPSQSHQQAPEEAIALRVGALSEIFSLSDRHNVTNPRVGWRHGGDATDVCQSTLLGKQSNKGSGQILPAHPTPTDDRFFVGTVWLKWAALVFNGFGTPVATTFPWGICFLRPRWPEHRGDTYLLLGHRWFSTRTYIWNARGARDLKILLQHHHL